MVELYVIITAKPQYFKLYGMRKVFENALRGMK